MSNTSFYKKLPLIFAIPFAMFFGIGALYFSTKLIPLFFQVTSLIEQGEVIGAKGTAVIITLIIMGCFTYAVALGFQLFQKRVIEILYDKT